MVGRPKMYIVASEKYSEIYVHIDRQVAILHKCMAMTFAVLSQSFHSNKFEHPGVQGRFEVLTRSKLPK